MAQTTEFVLHNDSVELFHNPDDTTKLVLQKAASVKLVNDSDDTYKRSGHK